ncbi:MAG: hypothetical protein IRZ14_01505 [Chloroflexi bacterium]|nr:hypothetical protein [Chloroflexota bacterium]
MSQRRRPAAAGLSLTAWIVGGLVALSLGIGGARLCLAPVDLSGSGSQLSAALTPAKSHDALVYEVHAVLGTLLRIGGCAPEAEGLQWLKAAAHASSDEQVARAAAGLRQARARAAPTSVFDTTLCRYVTRGFARPEQARAVAAAAIGCSPTRDAPHTATHHTMGGS